MRTTRITAHNNQVLEVFVQQHPIGFELWMVANIDKRRTVLKHYLTKDDLEADFAYARIGDLTWRDSSPNELPASRHSSAIEGENSIKRGIVVEYELLAYHFGVISLLSFDRKVWKVASQLIVGTWDDGIALLKLEANSQAVVKFSSGQSHPLNVGYIQSVPPDSWKFSDWQLFLMNDKNECGERLGILRVDEEELHFYSARRDCLAHVFHRVKAVDF